MHGVTETILEYITKIISLTNQMRSCVEEIKDQQVVEKVLKTLTSKYDHIVVAIEESKNLEEYKVEELQGSLEALQQVAKREGREVRLTQGECLHDSKEDQCLLMDTTKSHQEYAKDVQGIDFWYLDIGCSNHMTRRNEWFNTLDESVKRKVKFSDLNSVETEGIGKVMIQRRDGRRSYISNVLYVPKMKNNFLSLGQLLDKWYIMKMKNGVLNVFDEDKQMILKTLISLNRTFRIHIHIGEHKGLKTIAY
ncbi:PREDICTED: uncharacterized protein LOC109326347 [Lupinus angustifolius]|uniref:uncharacterized protein LOC109326347 n=1 Tax=Lupinus angustifolius TaxID=3871 RepID=UPI00092F1E59|nr:PREDICTED: uncharacterized protein LOC109326347 [Lupinus angustifolius]